MRQQDHKVSLRRVGVDKLSYDIMIVGLVIANDRGSVPSRTSPWPGSPLGKLHKPHRTLNSHRCGFKQVNKSSFRKDFRLHYISRPSFLASKLTGLSACFLNLQKTVDSPKYRSCETVWSGPRPHAVAGFNDCLARYLAALWQKSFRCADPWSLKRSCVLSHARKADKSKEKQTSNHPLHCSQVTTAAHLSRFDVILEVLPVVLFLLWRELVEPRGPVSHCVTVVPN